MSGLKRASGTPLTAMLVVAVVIIAGGFALSPYWQYVGAIGAVEAIFGLSFSGWNILEIDTVTDPVGQIAAAREFAEAAC